MKCFITAVLLVASIPIYAQIEDDLALYDGDFDFQEGIYRTFQEFKNNAPYFKVGLVQDNRGTKIPEMWREDEALFYPDENGELQPIDKEKMWGYSYRDAIYVQVNNTFERIMVLGSICHFLGTTTSYTSDPFGYYGGGSSRQTTQRQFMLDMENGGIYDFNTENLSAILERDQVLSEQFEDIPKKKKKDALFLFLRKYNERHALFFPR